ncbi:5-formyltetrahydrofolate cyclo-ligase [Fredinandcohnia quinoae]|uniref:5-formyltetrahydrofolate cyclo-ligase n=1 Tax=Fredinandcohnia quinoae TaxID=2918902 RepID=A0AAW5DWB2_9BACI|nr:5-formyltetrahydrofolate cyclo-ligase [Fredinandcohnia sp. SECRCQ15]MCH1624932.1 5-formyltetrahydrofolate cyclo-ligase [Fredinandcohnia sp. SECRCQ15]
METKKVLRKEMKEHLQLIDDSFLKIWSKSITEKIITLPEWNHAKTIGITISGKHEVNTEELIKMAWKANRRVVVPKCIPSTKKLVFREITSFSQLEVVFYGLKEPIEDQTKEVDQGDIDLLIVPGLRFTKEGYRLGHGGGYYDRFLTTYEGNTISLAFDIQIIDSLPIETFDLPVQKIITNEQMINCNE